MSQLEISPVYHPYVPRTSLSPEKIQEVLSSLDPCPEQKPTLVKALPYKHHPVDKNFIEMIKSLKPVMSQSLLPKFSLEDQRMLHALRRREYRNKTEPNLKKTKELLHGLRSRLAVNVITLRSLLNSSDFEEEMKRNVASLLGIKKEKVLEIPEVLSLFQKHWRRKRLVSELDVGHRSCLYIARVVQLQNQYNQKFGNWRNGVGSSVVMRRKLQDALMKAEAYEMFMNDKRVKKVMGALKANEVKLKKSLSKWLLEQSMEQ